MTNIAVAQKIKDFFSQFPSRVCKKGEMLMRVGDNEKLIYFLEKGHVRQYVNTKDGEEATLNIYKSGAFFPMAWVNDTYTNIYSFQAVDTVEVRIASFEKVLTFIKQEPDVLFDLLQRVYRGLDGLMAQKEQLMSGSASERLLHTLAIFKTRQIQIVLTHQELAALTGLTRETVSRQMSKLRAQGLV